MTDALHAPGPLDHVEALLFDVFGTVVDWRTSVADEMAQFAAPRGWQADWAQFAQDWRALYQPAMEETRAGRRSFTILDTLHRENLEALLERYQFAGVSETEKNQLTRIWHRLIPWPDVHEGLHRLRSRYIIAPLSNGNIGLMTRLAKHAELPWDAILGAEIAQAYKPLPEAYVRNAAALNLAPEQCMLVAAHNDDLTAARAVGYRTAFVVRPTEYGPTQTKDLKANSDWDVITSSFNGVADALGCPLFA